MSRTTASRVLTELILEVFRLNGGLLAAGDTLTRPAGQTSGRWQVLGALDGENLTVAEIGRRMGLTRQSVQRTTDLLEGAGLVSYIDNPAHQRAQLATLTPRGRATLDAITSRQIAWANRVAARLVEDDLRRAIRTLRGIRDAVDAAAVSAERSPILTRQRDRSRRTHTPKRRRAS